MGCAAAAIRPGRWRRHGSLKYGPITRLDGDHLIIVALWIDREAFPGQPLFNGETEGCLPMSIVLADSFDAGETWTAWREVPMPDDVGPPSLTNAIVRFPSGRLLLSVETNKTYLDPAPWFQRVVHAWSDDGGTTWSEPRTVVADPTGRIANWDQRGAVTKDGRLVSFAWIYDFEAVAYRNVRRRISTDDGESFGDPVELDFTDQPGHPALLDDGRVVLAWVDRFGTRSIRARRSRSDRRAVPGRHRDRPLRGDPRSWPRPASRATHRRRPRSTCRRGRTVSPSPKRCPDGDVGVVHYAPGPDGGLDVRWLRLGVDDE